MKIKYLYLCLSLLLSALSPTISTAQENNLSLRKGRIFTGDSSDKKFNSLSKTGDKIILTNKNGQTETMSTDDIMQIDQQTGSKALLFAGVMGGSALLGAVLGVVQAETSSGVKASSSSKTAIVLSLTTVGALVGALIGSKKKTYKTVYENPKYSFDPSPFKLDLKNQSGVSSLTFSYTF